MSKISIFVQYFNFWISNIKFLDFKHQIFTARTRNHGPGQNGFGFLFTLAFLTVDSDDDELLLRFGPFLLLPFPLTGPLLGLLPLGPLPGLPPDEGPFWPGRRIFGFISSHVRNRCLWSSSFRQ